MTDAIAVRARDVQPDQPQGKAALRVLPILGPSQDQPPYRLLDADTLRHVTVTETSPSGTVPELKVENRLDKRVFLMDGQALECNGGDGGWLDKRVFLMDGQELVGAKQNRVLNTDVLVPAKTTLKIPVSCVEAGRWRRISDAFVPGRSASHTIRARKMERVRRSLRERSKHDADQHAVWDEVQESMSKSASHSPTAALHDAYRQRDRDLTAFRASLRMPDGAVGLAVFHGERFLGLDLFDRHSTLVYFWQTLVDSYAIDWMMADTTGPASKDSEAVVVREHLERAAAGRWESFPSPGEGRDHRLDDQRLAGSALVWEDRSVLHLQLFPKDSAPGRSNRGPGTRFYE